MHKIGVRVQTCKNYYRYIPAAVPVPQWTRSSHCSTDSGSPFSLAKPNRIKFKGTASSYGRLVVTLKAKKRVKGAPIFWLSWCFLLLANSLPLAVQQLDLHVRICNTNCILTDSWQARWQLVSRMKKKMIAPLCYMVCAHPGANSVTSPPPPFF